MEGRTGGEMEAKGMEKNIYVVRKTEERKNVEGWPGKSDRIKWIKI